MIDRFDVCLPYTLKQECNVYTGTALDWTNPKNFDDDPQDPGGATQCGITHYDYEEFCEAHGLPETNVRYMGELAGTTIYRTKYWFPFCPKLKPGLDLFFFDTNVNMGQRRAVMLLQASLGIHADGAWGPQTEASVAEIVDAEVPHLIRDEEGRREKMYRSFRTFPRFGHDWLERDKEISEEALKMLPLEESNP